MAGVPSVYPPEIWARESLILLQNTHVAANLVHRNFEMEVAQFGDTVNTRKPDKFSVNSVTNTITGGGFTVQQATATNVQVVLDQHQHVAFGITGRDMDTSIKNLVEEFMEPAMIPMAQKIDDDLLGASGGLTDSTVAETLVATPGTLALADFANTRKTLRSQQVPMTPVGGVSRISIVLGTEHEAQALQITALAQANTSGLNPPPIRTGFINMIYGMNVFADQGVPVGATAADSQSVAFHRNAIALVTRPLESIGSEFGIRSSVMTKDGVGLRIMMSFDHVSAKWIVSVDILYGFKLLDALLATRLSDITG